MFESRNRGTLSGVLGVLVATLLTFSGFSANQAAASYGGGCTPPPASLQTGSGHNTVSGSVAVGGYCAYQLPGTSSSSPSRGGIGCTWAKQSDTWHDVYYSQQVPVANVTVGYKITRNGSEYSVTANPIWIQGSGPLDVNDTLDWTSVYNWNNSWATVDPGTHGFFQTVEIAYKDFVAHTDKNGNVSYTCNAFVYATNPVQTYLYQKPGASVPGNSQQYFSDLKAYLQVGSGLGKVAQNLTWADFVFVPVCAWISNPGAVLYGPVSATTYLNIPSSRNFTGYVEFYTLTMRSNGITYNFGDGTSASASGPGGPSSASVIPFTGCSNGAKMHVYKEVTNGSSTVQITASANIEFDFSWGHSYVGSPVIDGRQTSYATVPLQAGPSVPVYQIEGIPFR